MSRNIMPTQSHDSVGIHLALRMCKEVIIMKRDEICGMSVLEETAFISFSSLFNVVLVIFFVFSFMKPRKRVE